MSHPDDIFPSQETGLPVYYQTEDSYDYPPYYPVQDSYSLVPYPTPTSYLQDPNIAQVYNNDNNNIAFQTPVPSGHLENNLSSASSQGTPQGTPEILIASPYDSELPAPIPEPVNPGPSAVPITSNQISHDVRLKSNITAASLERHLLLISSRPKLYRCISCSMNSEILRGTQAAKAHVYQHLFGTSKPYICRTCNVEFASERAAERHRRNQEKKYPCQYCGRPFARKDAMRAHERKGKCGRSLGGFPSEAHQ